MSYLVRDIERAVCLRFQLTPTQMRSPNRKRVIARPRQIVMYLARQLTEASFPQIGRHLGGRDHTTVIHGQRKIAQLLRETNTMACEVESVREILQTLTPERQRVSASVARGLVLEAAE